MRLRNLFRLLAIGAVISLAGCGGGGGGSSSGGGTTPPPVTETVSLVASKNLALNVPANDSITLTATVSPTVTDGTTVTFLVTSGIATVTPLSSTTVGSKATAVVTSSTAGSVTVSASTAHGSGSATMKFIPQPTNAVVTLAINKSISKLDSLNLKVTNTAGATFTGTYSTLNEALVSNAFIQAGIAQGDPSNIVTVGLISVLGFDTVPNSPIIQLNYSVSAGLPTFAVSSVPGSSTLFFPIVLTPSDFVVNVIYN